MVPIQTRPGRNHARRPVFSSACARGEGGRGGGKSQEGFESAAGATTGVAVTRVRGRCDEKTKTTSRGFDIFQMRARRERTGTSS